MLFLIFSFLVYLFFFFFNYYYYKFLSLRPLSLQGDDGSVSKEFENVLRLVVAQKGLDGSGKCVVSWNDGYWCCSPPLGLLSSSCSLLLSSSLFWASTFSLASLLPDFLSLFFWLVFSASILCASTWWSGWSVLGRVTVGQVIYGTTSCWRALGLLAGPTRSRAGCEGGVVQEGGIREREMACFCYDVCCRCNLVLFPVWFVWN